jgi:DNA-binding beta-propeller fold protein YncE
VGQWFCVGLGVAFVTACRNGSAPSPGATYSGSGGGAPPTQPRIYSLASGLHHPQGLAYDAGVVYVADTDNDRIVSIQGGPPVVIAGDGTPGFTGDGGPATAARLHHPSDVVRDATGNLYVSDTDNNRIRRIDPFGTITTVCGDGVPGFAGDGGPATAARLHHPTGLALDPATGDLYVADARNQRVRRIDGAGTITTVAGDGTAGFSGDGGPATSAQLRLAAGYFRLGALAVDVYGAVWIADAGNHCIRKVDGGIITREVGQATFSGGGDGGPALDAGLAFPGGLAFAQNGDLILCDVANSSVRRVKLGPRTIWHVAGTGTPGFGGDGGVAKEAELHGPMGLAVDPATDELFLADLENDRVRTIR